MLESTRAPLKTVAYQCGFRDAQHMRSVFNRRLGVTPQQFRLQLLRPQHRPDIATGAGRQLAQELPGRQQFQGAAGVRRDFFFAEVRLLVPAFDVGLGLVAVVLCRRARRFVRPG